MPVVLLQFLDFSVRLAHGVRSMMRYEVQSICLAITLIKESGMSANRKIGFFVSILITFTNDIGVLSDKLNVLFGI